MVSKEVIASLFEACRAVAVGLFDVSVSLSGIRGVAFDELLDDSQLLWRRVERFDVGEC
jgi:hypothetical protein